MCLGECFWVFRDGLSEILDEEISLCRVGLFLQRPVCDRIRGRYRLLSYEIVVVGEVDTLLLSLWYGCKASPYHSHPPVVGIAPPL